MRAVIITNSKIDRFGYNAIICDEVINALNSMNVETKRLDYISEARKVLQAIKDNCVDFFICFNGFGTEIRISATLNLNQLDSAFDYFEKPLYDIMHDCPAHDWMAHQSSPVPRQRRMLVTDYSYALMAAELGAVSPRYVHSITYPSFVSPSRPLAERSIEVLLPIGLSSAIVFDERYQPNEGSGGRVKRFIFEEAVESSLADWSIDPHLEVVRICRRAGVPFSVTSEADRILLTSVENVVKFKRRERLFQAIKGLPVTLITDHLFELPEDSPVKIVNNLPADEVLRKMADSKLVICPTPHKNGFHERPMGAFSAGAVVVSAPNNVLEANFVHDRDFVAFRSDAQLVDVLEALLADPARMSRIADAGHRRAAALFPPLRLAETILSIHAIERRAALKSGPRP